MYKVVVVVMILGCAEGINNNNTVMYWGIYYIIRRGYETVVEYRLINGNDVDMGWNVMVVTCLVYYI